MGDMLPSPARTCIRICRNDSFKYAVFIEGVYKPFSTWTFARLYARRAAREMSLVRVSVEPGECFGYNRRPVVIAYGVAARPAICAEIIREATVVHIIEEVL